MSRERGWGRGQGTWCRRQLGMGLLTGRPKIEGCGMMARGTCGIATAGSVFQNGNISLTARFVKPRFPRRLMPIDSQVAGSG